MVRALVALLLFVPVLAFLRGKVPKFRSFPLLRDVANAQIPLLSPTLNGSFSAFQDADDLVLVIQTTPGAANFGRPYFVPSAVVNATEQEHWKWWQGRKMAEKILKSAVRSSKSDLSPYFDDYKRFLVTDKAEILQTHDEFFRAIHRGDFEAMRSLWHFTNESLCIPSGDFVYSGTNNILSYWSASLARPKPHISIRNVRLNFQGDLAVITCQMDIAVRGKAKSRGGGGKGEVRSSHVTTIFYRPPDRDRYFITAHIASPTAASLSRESLSVLQELYTDPSRPSRRKQRGEFVGGMQYMAGPAMPFGSMGYIGGPDGQPASIEDFFNHLTGEESPDDDGDEDEDGDRDDDDDDQEDEENVDGRGIYRYGEDEDNEDDEEDEDEDEDEDEEDEEDDDNDDEEGGDEDEYSRNQIRGNLFGLDEIGFTVSSTTPKRKNGPFAGSYNGGTSSANRVYVLDPRTGRLEQISGARPGGKRGGTGGSSGSGSSGSSGSSGVKRDRNRDRETGEDKEEEEAAEAEEEEASRLLAARAVETIRLLASQGRISQQLKQRLTRDVIDNMARGKYSSAEIAFALILGPGRPEDCVDSGYLNDPSFDAEALDKEDLDEFERVLQLL